MTTEKSKKSKKVKRALGRGLSDLSNLKLTEEKPSPTEVVKEKTDRPSARVICVASGKGGTGKSTFTTNLSAQFAKSNSKVIVLDADMGLANIHLMLGMTPNDNILHLLSGHGKISDVLVSTPFGFRLISGGSGLSELADLGAYHVEQLAYSLSKLEKEADLLMVDMPAGIAPQTLVYLHAANEVIIVTTPEITAITDAYATVKATVQSNRSALISIVVNRTRSRREGEVVFEKLDQLSQECLKKRLVYYGHIIEDGMVAQSVRDRSPIAISSPNSRFSRAIRRIADKIELVGKEYGHKLSLTTGNFFMRMRDQILD